MELKNLKLPSPSKHHCADQCRELGIRVDDTIESRITNDSGGWNDVRLTLLWLGETIAVWRHFKRHDRHPVWEDLGEESTWRLQYREWYRLPKAFVDIINSSSLDKEERIHQKQPVNEELFKHVQASLLSQEIEK